MARGGSGSTADVSLVLGRPTDRAVTLSILSPIAVEARVEYGTAPGAYVAKTDVRRAQAGVPLEVESRPLIPNTRYYYHVVARDPGGGVFRSRAEGTFHTQRAPGSTFVFAVQGDSHPERVGKMFNAELYVQTLRNVAKDAPDFYFTMGDDFSIERLIERHTLAQAAVDQVYAYQRRFLGVVGRSSALFLVNGNHEQAARYLLDGTENNAAVMAARARTRFYPLPAPDGFYTGDAEEVEHIGLLRDYYAWTWGDALFVVIDPYWHSSVPVDNEAGHRPNRGRRRRNLWEVTLGKAQYRWLTSTLTKSKARWKFVFCHHVLGTGRGGIEMADLYEWGGKDRKGAFTFPEKRPGWDLPIHQLMARTGVTIFFQGHDHLYARQELNGVIYQTCPCPADPTYTAFNRDAYRSGEVLPNSGYLRVNVSPERVKVNYVRCYLPKDTTDKNKTGDVAYGYEIKPKAAPTTTSAPVAEQ